MKKLIYEQNGWIFKTECPVYKERKVGSGMCIGCSHFISKQTDVVLCRGCSNSKCK